MIFVLLLLFRLTVFCNASSEGIVRGLCFFFALQWRGDSSLEVKNRDKMPVTRKKRDHRLVHPTPTGLGNTLLLCPLCA